ncbi:VCBS repeat-containing protein [Streptomyces sp. NPDC097619]|uniref:FG-GAP repeat domain-containing protein n=1 Tax=Streptomyces sp. NPDC097619 TaxID=3157228 RepID=UPI003323FE53
MFGGSAVLLAAGSVPAFAAGAAGSADDYAFTFKDHVVAPGEGSVVALKPDTVDGTPNGTLVFAMSGAPLTDASWAKGGLPAGMSARTDDSCTVSPTVKGVYFCATGEDTGWVGPAVSAADSVKNLTKLHFGVAYAPRGTDLKAAVKKAQLAGSAPQKGRVEAHAVTVLTSDHVKKNKLTLKTPAVKAGSEVTQSVTVQARDAGQLRLSFGPGEGQRYWDKGELKVSLVSAKPGPGASDCQVTPGELTWDGLVCDVAARNGADVTVTYVLKAEAKAPAWKLAANASYQVYTSGWGDGPTADKEFAVDSPFAVKERHMLLARKKGTKGELTVFQGTGKAPKVFAPAETYGEGWAKYTAVTKLSPVKIQMAGGPVVARDAAGVLWNYHLGRDGGLWEPKKVGAGWNMYDSLTGAGDVTGDGKADLLAREPGGRLWLYPGTGDAAKPFGAKVKVGAGWQVFDAVTAVGDVTGDGKADLLARNRGGGESFVYAGTGLAARPFEKPVSAGLGFKRFDALNSSGDLDSDLKADLLARDAAGVMWLYRATGQAAKPFQEPVKIGGGFDKYDLLF